MTVLMSRMLILNGASSSIVVIVKEAMRLFSFCYKRDTLSCFLANRDLLLSKVQDKQSLCSRRGLFTEFKLIRYEDTSTLAELTIRTFHDST